MSRIARKTKETDIVLELKLDNKGACAFESGVAFFDHMLGALCKHSGISVSGFCRGDLEVDCHHTMEDVGIVLGSALKEELGDTPRVRFGEASVPMDEALCTAALDICNRPYLVYNIDLFAVDLGGFDAQLLEEFWRAFAIAAGITLHINKEYGRNAHHIAEAAFKAVARALKKAVEPSDALLSTKGTL